MYREWTLHMPMLIPGINVTAADYAGKIHVAFVLLLLAGCDLKNDSYELRKGDQTRLLKTHTKNFGCNSR